MLPRQSVCVAQYVKCPYLPVVPSPTPAIMSAWEHSFGECLSEILPESLGSAWEPSVRMGQRRACALRIADGARVCVAVHPGIYAITPRSAAMRIADQLLDLAHSRRLIT